MKTPTFKEQYEKIVTAYLRDELEPMKSCACFVGNLLNGKDGWGTGCFPESKNIDVITIESNGLYTCEEIHEIEMLFMHGERGTSKKISWSDYDRGKPKDAHYHEQLYLAMERTLIFLRQIHESKGEIVEDYQFTKRETALNEKVWKTTATTKN